MKYNEQLGTTYFLTVRTFLEEKKYIRCLSNDLKMLNKILYKVLRTM